MTPYELHERGRRPRLNLSYSLRLHRPGRGDAVAARTEDIRCQGFYFTSAQPFLPSEKLECELVIQAETPGRQTEPDVLLRG